MGPGWLISDALRDAPGISACGFLPLVLPAGIISPPTMRGGSCRFGVGLLGMESPFSPSTQIEGTVRAQELPDVRNIDQVRELVWILAYHKQFLRRTWIGKHLQMLRVGLASSMSFPKLISCWILNHPTRNIGSADSENCFEYRDNPQTSPSVHGSCTHASYAPQTQHP